MEKSRRTVGGTGRDWAGACGEELTGQAQRKHQTTLAPWGTGIGDLGSKENKTNPNWPLFSG